MTETLVTVAAGVLVAVGVTGTVLPALPGIGLVWLTMLAYGLVTGFGLVGWTALALASVLAVLGTVLGIDIPRRAAAAEGVAAGGQLLGLTLAVVGFFVVPVVGAPLGFTLGVWLTRVRAGGDPRAAWASTRRTIGALARAALVQFACALGMAALWVAWVVWGRAP